LVDLPLGVFISGATLVERFREVGRTGEWIGGMDGWMEGGIKEGKKAHLSRLRYDDMR
jgi:hypothetical protein